MTGGGPFRDPSYAMVERAAELQRSIATTTEELARVDANIEMLSKIQQDHLVPARAEDREGVYMLGQVVGTVVGLALGLLAAFTALMLIGALLR